VFSTKLAICAQIEIAVIGIGIRLEVSDRIGAGSDGAEKRVVLVTNFEWQAAAKGANRGVEMEGKRGDGSAAGRTIN